MSIFFASSCVMNPCKLIVFSYLTVLICSAHDLIEKAQIIGNLYPFLLYFVSLGYPQITCSPKWITIWFETSVPFQGRIFVEEHPYDTRCSSTYISNLDNNATFRLPIIPCANTPNKVSFLFNLTTFFKYLVRFLLCNCQCASHVSSCKFVYLIYILFRFSVLHHK